MGIEIEIKLKVESLEAVRKQLGTVGAECLGRVLEANYIYDKQDGSLAANDSALRLRGLTHADGTAGITTMTYKGRREPGDVKVRPEIEIEISDLQAARQMLAELRFRRILSYEKHRESWRLGSCTVELDEVPYLGIFVEVEGPDVSAVREVQARIGLAHLEPIGHTYVTMLLEYCRHTGIGDRVIVFPESNRRPHRPH